MTNYHNVIIKPILKWPGGKETELKHIIPRVPLSFNNYYEPFVGGGSVFGAIQAKKYFINDFSTELITLYNSIAHRHSRFFYYGEILNTVWNNSKLFFINNPVLINIYSQYSQSIIEPSELKHTIEHFCEQNRNSIISIIVDFDYDSAFLCTEMKKNLFRKMSRMKQLETTMRPLPYKDLCDNIETAIKSAVYMYIRYLYNNPQIYNHNIDIYTAVFYFIRNYCYSGMFRYNDKGDFNVPYGGIAYNNKSLTKKLEYFQTNEISERFSRTEICNLDFEDFLTRYKPNINDFIFLDPPYDSEFSTYSNNEFTHKDQKRLADYLINKCHAKWMLIIKNTDFIYDLYSKHNINIQAFQKEYQVSFMNRNNKKVTHLLITNYNQS